MAPLLLTKDARAYDIKERRPDLGNEYQPINSKDFYICIIFFNTHR